MPALRITGFALIGVAALIALVLVGFATNTRSEIDALEAQVIARATPVGAVSPAALAALPPPVRAWVAYTFPNAIPEAPRFAEIEMAGAFRRPEVETFSSTTARQVASLRQPDMVFSADTPILRLGWAIAYDRYIGGEMEMNARLLSAVTVMHAEGDPQLDAISLRRWLMEAPTYPMALLPGGPVRWEPVDATHALAVAEAHGTRTEALATFDADGALTLFEATAPGDLATAYHGSGEHLARSDYQLVDGIRVPMGFEIARVGADGVVRPFWVGRITALRFHD